MPTFPRLDTEQNTFLETAKNSKDLDSSHITELWVQFLFLCHLKNWWLVAEPVIVLVTLHFFLLTLKKKSKDGDIIIDPHIQLWVTYFEDQLLN